MSTHVHPVPAHGPDDGPRAEPAHAALSLEHWERLNPPALLGAHAALGLAVGLLVLLAGGSAIFADTALTRLLLGGPPVVGGALLATGLLRRPASVVVQLAGIAVLAAWNLAMASGFLAAAAVGGDVALVWPWDAGTGGSAPRLYPVALFLGLFLLLALHLRTVRQVRVTARRAQVRVARVHPTDEPGPL